MLNNSTTAGPPHFVDLHVNPGESVSIQLFDGNETVLRGPATVTMISQHTFPPVPMPVQVPPGHMVQQIVDENGTLRHIILSAINNNGTNSTPPATLVPQQQAYPYSCCCYCYCSSMPSPNPLPTPPPPPPPPPPIHPSNLWEMGLTHVDSTRRLPFSRTNNSKVNCNIDVTFPPSPTGTTIRRRLPNRNNYSYSKRSPLLQQVTSNTSNTSTTTTTTTTTSIGSINNNTSITTTTITTTATGTSPSSNTNHHHSNSFIVNGVTSTTTITTAKLTSSGVLSIATVTSNLTATTTTTTTVAAISTTTGSSTHNNNNNINKDNLSSTPIRGINGKSQTLTVTVSETGSVSKTGAITFPVTHLRTNGGNMATKLTASIPELITSTDQSTKQQQQQHHHHSHQHQYQHPHGHQHTHQHSHQHHSHQSQSAKIEFLFTNANNNSVTSGSYNNNYNNKHNSIVSNLPSTTSNHHHHHHHHHHNIVNHGGDKLIGDSEKMKITSHHNKDNSSSGVLINRNSTITTTTSTTTTTTTTTTTPTNGLLIGSPSSPIKNVVGSLKSVTTNTTIKGSSFLKSDSKSSPPSSNHSPKNDHLSRKVRREEKTINNNKEDKESINKSKENTPQRKKSNINSNGGGNYNLDGEIGKNHSSGASSSNNSKESSPIKIPLNHSSHCKPSLQSPLPTINIPLNVTLATGPSTATLPIISIPMEASTFTKKRCDSLLTTTVNSVDPVGIKSRKESKESSGNNYDSRNPVTKSITGRNLNNRDQQQLSTSSGALPISVIVNDADSLSVESPLILIESETTSNDKSTTKLNDLKVIDSNHIEDNGDSNEKDESVDENSTIQRLTSPKKGQEAKKRKDKTDQSDGQTNQQLNGKEENNLEDNLVIKDPKPVDNKESLKVKDEIDGDKEIKDDSITVNDITAEEKCKSDDKIDSQQMITSLVSSITTTTSTKTTVFNENITANVVGAEENEKTSTHTRDNQDKDYGDKNVDENSEEEEVEDEDEDDDEEESQLTGDNNKNNCITSNTMETNAAYGDSSDINRVKVKSSPQRSPKHLLPQIQVFCLNYTSLTATSVKLKWINEQGHHNNYHHSHHHFQSSSYGGGSILSETRHYMVEMMKLNRSNAKNGTVTPTTRIVYQGTQASCRVSHLTPSEQYSFRVRSSENNHQLVSNVLTVVTPEHQPVNKHHKRSRTQNSNQQIQFTSESSSQKQQHIIQNQEQAASRQQESLNNKIDGETRIIRSEQKCAIVIISLVSVLAVVLACIIHNLLMY